MIEKNEHLKKKNGTTIREVKTMNEDEKTFEKQKDGSLKVTVESKNKLLIPMGAEGNKCIGEYIQTTTQHIEKDHVATLKQFIKAEKEKAEDQLNKMKKQLEQLSAVNPDLIPEDMKAKFEKAFSKGNKQFKEQLQFMNSYLLQSTQKKQLIGQIAYMENQINQINKDWKEMVDM